MLGPLISGSLLESLRVGFGLPRHHPSCAARPLHGLASRARPTSTRPRSAVDNIGGLLSAVMIGALVVSTQLHRRFRTCRPWPSDSSPSRTITLGLFVRRQRRAANPLYDLQRSQRDGPSGWPRSPASSSSARSWAIAFINQQYLQNVLGYDTLQAGAAILPAVVFMVLVAPRSARLVQERGSRATLLLGQAMLGLAFIGDVLPVG